MRTTYTVLLFVFITEIVKSQTGNTIVTDSSTIVTERGAYKTVEEKMKSRNLIYFTSYYRDKLFETATLDTFENYIGIYTQYDKKGKPLYTVDYDNGVWTVFDTKLYSNYELLKSIKQKADSFIIANYSEQFFTQHVNWNFYESVFWNDKHKGDGDGGIDWSEQVKWKPDKFIISYRIRNGNNDYPNSFIEIRLDSNGIFLADEFSSRFGFEKLPVNSPRNFNLSYSKAKELAIAQGLVETDSNKTEIYLKKEYISNHTIYNRNYRIYVVQKFNRDTVNIKSILIYEVRDNYNVWVFNPWTGDFVAKKKMHSSVHFTRLGTWGDFDAKHLSDGQD